MALGTINTNQIASEAVNTNQIANEAVTVPKVTDQVLSSRNLIINGAMQVAQRSTSATGLGASSGYFTVDRINFGSSGTSAGRFTMTQTADGPSGFANCLKLDCTTADASVAATEWEHLQYSVEAQDLQRLGFGSSDAESFVLSFYVKGNAAATYTMGAYQVDANRWMAQTFSVTSSWNRVSLLWPKDVSGYIADDNGNGMAFYLTLQVGTNFTSGSVPATWETLNTTDIADSGQTQFFDSTSRTLSITGLQMEIGEVATPFEHEPFSVTQQKCFRYYYNSRFGSNDGGAYSSGRDAQYGHVRACFAQFPVKMRATPTVSIQSSSANSMDRFGRGQEECFPKADNIHPDHFQNIVKYTSSAQTTTANWTDSGNYINRAGYKADAEL